MRTATDEELNKELDDDVWLLKARSQEAIIDKKAEVADNLAVLTGFLLSFALGSLFSLSAGDFNNSIYFQIYSVALVSSSSAGLGSAIVFAFLASKIRRLLGRTLAKVGGDDVDVDALNKMYKGNSWRTKVPIPSEVRFFASCWYYLGKEYDNDQKPYAIKGFQLMDMALQMFKMMMFGFAVSIAVKILDQLPSVIAGILVVGMSTGLLGAMIPVVLSGAMWDLS